MSIRRGHLHSKSHVPDFRLAEEAWREGGTIAHKERSIRLIALNRKNALFAGHDEGGRNWGRIASFIETCKLNNVEPYAYL